MRAAITVTTTPAEVVPADQERDTLILANTSGSTIYYDVTGDGSSPLTTSNSIPLPANTVLFLTGNVAKQAIFALVASGTASLVAQGIEATN